MFFNKYWFRKLYSDRFVAVITYYAQSLEKKILPAFANITDEADLVAQQAEERMGQYFDPDRDDPAAYTEAAYDESVDFFIMADGIRGGILNMFTAGLYHLFEQQLLKIHRQELLNAVESRPPVADSLLKIAEIKRRLLDRDIDIERFPSWQKLDELRLVANTVKHADGVSCGQLKTRRPDLFVHPATDRSLGMDLSFHQVVQPLAGEDLFIQIDHFMEYADAVKAFWDEFATAVEALPSS